mmetsp:Transcript_197/g.284  ORF Transcript_197/g.284 Transcript_197/m.284 type:complete len:179 (-) Transcript_197:115-651(-)
MGLMGDLLDALGLEHFGENNSGEVAVDKAIALVAEVSNDARLSDASVFLRRIAKAESDFGRHPSTFRNSYYGGIWQVDRVGYEETKNVMAHPSLRRLHASVEKKFSWMGLPGVVWSKSSWNDCIIPAYSCMAARLFLALITTSIPRSLPDQAKYWKTHYNTPSGAGTERHFIESNENN